MFAKKATPEQVLNEQRQKMEEDRRKLVMIRVKLPNGATFTRLKAVGQ